MIIKQLRLLGPGIIIISITSAHSAFTGMSKSLFDMVGLDRTDVKAYSRNLQQAAAVQQAHAVHGQNIRTKKTEFCFKACIKRFNAAALGDDERVCVDKCVTRLTEFETTVLQSLALPSADAPA
jgi:hypothetical protein